jgi:hypothetical protein
MLGAPTITIQRDPPRHRPQECIGGAGPAARRRPRARGPTGRAARRAAAGPQGAGRAGRPTQRRPFLIVRGGAAVRAPRHHSGPSPRPHSGAAAARSTRACTTTPTRARGAARLQPACATSTRPCASSTSPRRSCCSGSRCAAGFGAISTPPRSVRAENHQWNMERGMQMTPAARGSAADEREPALGAAGPARPRPRPARPLGGLALQPRLQGAGGGSRRRRRGRR